MKTNHRGLKIIALQSYLHNIAQQVRAKGFHKVVLKSGGTVTGDTLLDLCNKCGFCMQYHNGAYLIAQPKVAV